MTTYHIPRGDRSVTEYYDYVAALPWVWQSGPANFAIDPTLGHVTVPASIDGFEIVLSQAGATPRRLSKLAFVGRMGADFADVLSAAKVSTEVEMFVRMLDWATPDPDGTSVDLDDPRVVGALNALEAAQIISAGRAAEILGA